MTAICRSGRTAASVAEVETFARVPPGIYVSDVVASPRQRQHRLRGLNNWQRGDFKPYLLKRRIVAARSRRSPATCRTGIRCGRSSRTTSTAACCSPAPSSGCSSRLTAVSAGSSFAAACRRRRCATWTCSGARTIWCSARSAAASTCWMTTVRCARHTQALRQEAALFPLRHAYQFPTLGQYRGSDGNWSSPNPPYGAVLTYHVREVMPPGTSLAIRISDPSGAWYGT